MKELAPNTPRATIPNIPNIHLELYREKGPESTKEEPAPDFHALTEEALQALRYAYREFVAAYRAAAERLKAGDLSVVFPKNCFPPRLPAPPVR